MYMSASTSIMVSYSCRSYSQNDLDVYLGLHIAVCINLFIYSYI